MKLQFDAITYRKMALFTENELEELSANAERFLIPVIGNLQYFPRATPETSILSYQVSLLQERANEAIAIFYNFAVLAETAKEFSLHPLLEEQLEAKIDPFVKYYQNRQEQQPKNPDDKTTEPEKRNDKE